MYDYVIHGGLVVNENGVQRADVGVRGEKIAAVTATIDPREGKKSRDAGGLLVFPGIIDPHSHPVYEDLIDNTALAAAYGGTTHMIHYAYVKPGQAMLETIQWFKEQGLAHSVLDFSLHAGFFDAPNQIPLIPEMFKLGVTSGKIFMAYAKLKWMTDDYWLMAAADILAESGGLLMVHAENGLANDYLEDKYLVKEGRSQKEVFLMTNPDRLEAEAVNRAAQIAQVAGCPLYVVHNSAGLNMEVVRRLKGEGMRLYAETCPQYLCLNHDVYQRFGALAKVGPPIRTEKDRLALWQGVADGAIDLIGSDHAAKAKGLEDDFTRAPYGSPECETVLTLIYDEGINKGWISLPRLVKILSANPAKVFGLYPQKGLIAPGSDADLVLFDPSRQHTITHQEMHTHVGYTLFHGREVLGQPVFSMQRGHELLVDGQVVLPPGNARFYPTQAGRVDPLELR
ncbi:MAG: amidohydrolase family protein [bacterium]